VRDAIAGIDHVQIAAPAGCEDEARRFYGELLGLEEVAKPPVLTARGGVWFRVGRQELHVGVAEPFLPATKAHPAFRVSSVDELERLAARFAADGVAVVRPEPEEIPDTRRIFVHDPWGNRVELIVRSPRR